MRRSLLIAWMILVCLMILFPVQAFAGRAAQIETATVEATVLPSDTPAPPQETPADTQPVVEPTAEQTAEQTLTLTLPVVETTTAPTTAETAAPPYVFEVTGIEPGRLTSEAGGPISIYGSGFLPGTAVRLVGFGLLDSAVLNSSAIRAVVPPGLKKGSYTLNIIVPDGPTVAVENAFRITPDKNPTPTATASGRSSVFAQPQILVQSAATNPEILRPGSPFTLTFQITNQGGYTAANVRVSLGASTLAVPREGSSLWVVNQLPAKESAEISLPLALVDSAPAGYGTLELVVEYNDYLGQPYKSSQNVGLRISRDLSSQPLVLLTAYRTQPEALSPGDTFLLTLEITNAGKSDTGQVLVTLGGGESGSGISPFAILGASNVKFLPQLAHGKTVQVEHQLILDGAAESGVYNLPVSLAYDDLNGERRTENHVINLLVNRRPKIQVNFYHPPDPGLVGQPLLLPIELVNIGRTMVNVSTAEIGGENLEFTTRSMYIGALDGGTAGTLDAEVVPQKSGSLPVLVSVHYLDDFNQPQVLTETLTVQVEAPAAPVEGEGAGKENPEEGPGTWFVRILRGLLGLGS